MIKEFFRLKASEKVFPNLSVEYWKWETLELKEFPLNSNLKKHVKFVFIKSRWKHRNQLATVSFEKRLRIQNFSVIYLIKRINLKLSSHKDRVHCLN